MGFYKQEQIGKMSKRRKKVVKKVAKRVMTTEAFRQMESYYGGVLTDNMVVQWPPVLKVAPEELIATHLADDPPDCSGAKIEPLSEEHRAKISSSMKGNSPWNKGKKLSEEHRAKLSQAARGERSVNTNLTETT